MGFATLKQRMQSGEQLLGTFVKTPNVEVIELLNLAGLDFAVLDAEHAACDRRDIDVCMAVARALDFPLLVRVVEGTHAAILQALDAGAVGIVVPHVDSVEKAQTIAKAARFGNGGRGYAGSTRWANYTTRSMADNLKRSQDETIVIGQIEEPEAVDAIEAIVAVEGLDAVFIGPADLTVGYGETNVDNQKLKDAMARVGHAARKAGLNYATWVPNPQSAKALSEYGFTVFVIGSEHSWLLQGARSAVSEMRNDG